MRRYLKDLRVEAKMTQIQLANKLDVSESYYSLIENGERQKNMSIGLLSKIANALNISADRILKLETEWKQKLSKDT